jgi:hypothetical protein
LCTQAEDVDLVFVGFVDFGEFGAEIIFGDVGAVGVEDVTVIAELDESFWDEIVGRWEWWR